MRDARDDFHGGRSNNRMDWEMLAEAVRHGMRPASLFIWAFFGVLLSYAFWPYSAVFLAGLVPFWLVRAWKIFREETDAGISRFPPLCREDWRVARSKLKKGKR